MNTPTDWQDIRLAVVDIEGNGRRPPDIVEIAIVSMHGIDIGESKSWLLKPSERITWHAKRVHGISNSDVEECPRWADVADEFRERLDSRYLVAHNASVELGILRPKMPDWEPLGVLDTLKLARRFRPDLKKHGLGALLDAYALREALTQTLSTGLHRAEFDALGTAHLLVHLAKDDNNELRPFAELTAEPSPAPKTTTQQELF